MTQHYAFSPLVPVPAGTGPIGPEMCRLLEETEFPTGRFHLQQWPTGPRPAQENDPGLIPPAVRYALQAGQAAVIPAGRRATRTVLRRGLFDPVSHSPLIRPLARLCERRCQFEWHTTRSRTAPKPLSG